VLAAYWLVLPIRLPAGNDGGSSDECLTMADRPPADGGGAVARLERCSTLTPHDVELIADLAAAYEQAGRAADAEAAYQRVLAIDPEHGDVHARLATLLLSRGAAAQAKTHAEAALRLQPNRRSLLDLIARASQQEAATR
jgi:Flp pilus assembly protein TadD